jgi:hypothetical protein
MASSTSNGTTRKSESVRKNAKGVAPTLGDAFGIRNKPK